MHRLLLDIRAEEVRLALTEKRVLALETAVDEQILPVTSTTPVHSIFTLNGRASPFGFAIIGGHDGHEMHVHAPDVPITMITMESFYR